MNFSQAIASLLTKARATTRTNAHRFIRPLLLAALLPALLGASLPARADSAQLATAIDALIGKFNSSGFADVRPLWGNNDANILAAISRAQPSVPVSNPFAADVDLLDAINSAKNDVNGSAEAATCLATLYFGQHGAYSDTRSCIAAASRADVRSELQRRHWPLLTFGNSDLTTTPNGAALLFIHNGSGQLRQAFLLINAAD